MGARQVMHKINQAIDNRRYGVPRIIISGAPGAPPVEFYILYIYIYIYII